MFDFGKYLTPRQAMEKDMATEDGRREPLSFYEHLAVKDALCEVCEVEHIWKLVDTGMCFACTTGESDASDDYELF